jgi:uridine phosphorylase
MEYHLQTSPGDIAARCLLVGAPERAEMIAKDFLKDAKKVGDHRGLKSFTGTFEGVAVSVVTTGMGGGSTAIVLPEAVRSGAKVFVRVGSCGAIQHGIELGDAIIATGAVRYEGSSENWAPIEWPAVADYRLVGLLKSAAEVEGVTHHVGIGVTTSDFNEGQARSNEPDGWLAERIKSRHEEVIRRGALFYSMEEATIFTWCTTHGNTPAASIDTVYAQRTVSPVAKAFDDGPATRVALKALAKMKI